MAAAVLWAMPVHAAQCGKASWYGEAHHGRLMANGKPFNVHALTAASNSLPLGAWALVTAKPSVRVECELLQAALRHR